MVQKVVLSRINKNLLFSLENNLSELALVTLKKQKKSEKVSVTVT